MPLRVYCYAPLGYATPDARHGFSLKATCCAPYMRDAAAYIRRRIHMNVNTLPRAPYIRHAMPIERYDIRALFIFAAAAAYDTFD